MSRKIINNLDSLLKVRQDINSNFEELYNRPSGGGGTTDYSDLDNKPSINGVTLEGNKTSDDLKIEGIPGKDGSTWYNGNRAPGSDLGLNGDYYLDTGSGNIYNKKEGSWSVIMNIGSGGGSTPVAEVYLADYIYEGTPSVSQYSELKEAIDAGKIIVASYKFSGSTPYTQYIVCNATKDVDNSRIYVSYTYTDGSNISIVTKNYSISGESVSVNNSIKYLIDTKSIEDSLTSSSVSRVLSANQGKILKDLIDSLTSRVDSITGSFEIVIVDSLPDSGEKGKIYFVKKSSFLNDTYDEYMWINEAWEKLGSTSVNLSDYYNKTETDSLLENKQNKTDDTLLTEAKDIVEAINEIFNKLGSGSGGTAELYEFNYLTKGTPSLEDFNNLKTAIQSGKIITGKIVDITSTKEYVLCHDSSASDDRIYLRYLYSSDDGPAIKTILMTLSTDTVKVNRSDKILITDFNVRDDLSGGEYTTDVLSANQGKVLKELIDNIDTSGGSGTPGSLWYNGPGAPDIMIGTERDYYLDTTNYDIYSKVSGNWEIIGNIKGGLGEQGEKGETGKPGSVWFNGAGAPTQETGLDGDYYLDNETGDVYNKKDNTWSKVANLKGPEGSGSSGGVTNFVITSEDDLTTLKAKPGDTATFYKKDIIEGGAWQLSKAPVIEGSSAIREYPKVLFNRIKSEYIKVARYTRSSDSKNYHALLRSSDAITWEYAKDLENITELLFSTGDWLVGYSTSIYYLDPNDYTEIKPETSGVTFISDVLHKYRDIVKTSDGIAVSTTYNGNGEASKIFITKDNGITWESYEATSAVRGFDFYEGKFYILVSTSSDNLKITANFDTLESKTLNFISSASSKLPIKIHNGKMYLAYSTYLKEVNLETLETKDLLTGLNSSVERKNFAVKENTLYYFDGGSKATVYRLNEDGNFDLVTSVGSDVTIRSQDGVRLSLSELNNDLILDSPYRSSSTSYPNAVNVNGEASGESTIRRAYILVNDPTVKEDWLKLA